MSENMELIGRVQASAKAVDSVGRAMAGFRSVSELLSVCPTPSLDDISKLLSVQAFILQDEGLKLLSYGVAEQRQKVTHQGLQALAAARSAVTAVADILARNRLDERRDKELAWRISSKAEEDEKPADSEEHGSCDT